MPKGKAVLLQCAIVGTGVAGIFVPNDPGCLFWLMPSILLSLHPYSLNFLHFYLHKNVCEYKILFGLEHHIKDAYDLSLTFFFST